MNYIGIAGPAGIGKDLFAELLLKQVYGKRIALADSLKEEIKPFCIANYGIDPVNCSPEEKELVRPFMLTHGHLKRIQSKGRYWVDKLVEKVNGLVGEVYWCGSYSYTNDPEYIVIPDIRMMEYEVDEVHFLREELGGKLIYLQGVKEVVKRGKVYEEEIEPVIPQEQRNCPKLKNAADIVVNWPRTDKENILEKIVKDTLSEIIK